MSSYVEVLIAAILVDSISGFSRNRNKTFLYILFFTLRSSGFIVLGLAVGPDLSFVIIITIQCLVNFFCSLFVTLYSWRVVEVSGAALIEIYLCACLGEVASCVHRYVHCCAVIVYFSSCHSFGLSVPWEWQEYII